MVAYDEVMATEDVPTNNPDALTDDNNVPIISRHSVKLATCDVVPPIERGML